MKKFAEKTGGIVIMQHRLKRWWNIPIIWPICFAVMFGQDIAILSLKKPFDVFSLLESLTLEGQLKVVYSEILPVIMAMLQSGLKAVATQQNDTESPSAERTNESGYLVNEGMTLSGSQQKHFMSLNTELDVTGM